MENQFYIGPLKRVILCKSVFKNLNKTIILFNDLGYWGIVDLLVRNGIDVNLTDDYGKTALQWACGSGNSNILILLLHESSTFLYLSKTSYECM